MSRGGRQPGRFARVCQTPSRVLNVVAAAQHRTVPELLGAPFAYARRPGRRFGHRSGRQAPWRPRQPRHGGGLPCRTTAHPARQRAMLRIFAASCRKPYHNSGGSPIPDLFGFAWVLQGAVRRIRVRPCRDDRASGTGLRVVGQIGHAAPGLNRVDAFAFLA